MAAVRNPTGLGLALFASLLLYVFGFPYLGASGPGRGALAVLAAILPVLALACVEIRGWRLWVGVALGVPALAAILHATLALGFVSPFVGQAVPTLFYAYATTVLVADVVRTPRVDAAAILRILSGYLLMGYTFWGAYLSVELGDPGSLRLAGGGNASPGDLLYFSIVTLTTLGYGDIVPVGRQARSLAMLEALAGVLYLAVLVARLVAAYSPTAKEGSS